MVEDVGANRVGIGVSAGAVDRRVDRPERVWVGDRPVTAHRQPGTVPLYRREGKVRPFPGTAEKRKLAFHDLFVTTRPQRLDVGDDAEPGEPRNILGINDIEMGYLMRHVDAGVFGLGGRKRVEAFAHGPIADGMHMDCESMTRQCCGDLLEVVWLDEGQSGQIVRAARCTVRRKHCRGAVFADAVLHHLDRRRGEPGVTRLGAAGPHAIDLFQTLVGFPPQCADDTGGQFRDGWFCSRDLFTRDRQGFYVHQGRSDELVKVAGQWVWPAELEQAALGAAAVAEAACVPVPDGEGLQRLALFVTGKENAASAAQAACERLPRHKRPKWVRAVAELPRTASGKVQRYKLRELLERELARSG